MNSNISPQRQSVEELSLLGLETHRANLRSEIKTLESTMQAWWTTKHREEYRQALTAGRETLKDIEVEIARRSVVYLQDLTHKITKLPTETPAHDNQEGNHSHD